MRERGSRQGWLLSISGLSSWGEGCLALSQGTVKEVRLCGERGGWVQIGHAEYSLPGDSNNGLSGSDLGGADLTSLCP